ncbi:MAG TPA: lysylphosphatidylglycerol synthase transmembrane domain-containing protein [Solirubrobacteraceae bacterium]|jgi:uncharacterized membrane protein YbhN (UPF0104 family)|nr:lysylphosphatidylglycerol synthase transmembrane domain-containing protein [Solirubrobacteraceae bacterium]
MAVEATAASGAPEALPPEVSSRNVKKGLLKIGGVIVVVVIVITLLPGLGSLRNEFSKASPGWIVAGVFLEMLSTLAYVPAFRSVFCTRMGWGAASKIALSEEAADSVLPVGGAGGLALGAWALRRAGMPADEIGRKTVAFFLLTSVPNVVTLALVGLGLAVAVLPGHASLALELVPVAVAAGAIGFTLALGRLSRELAVKAAAKPRSRLAKIAPALHALADGVVESLRLLRRGDPWLLVGIFGYMVWDILVLWGAFRAIGLSPELTIVWMAYVIGQLGNLIPLPGGIGGVELGLVGMLVLYGEKAVASTAAVLIYRAIQLWVPAVIGGIAFVQLRRLLRHEAASIELCQPGDEVEILGAGAVVLKPAS